LSLDNLLLDLKLFWFSVQKLTRSDAKNSALRKNNYALQH